MRRNRRRGGPPPGGEFLEALATGKPPPDPDQAGEPAPAGPSEGPDPAERVADAERRAGTAEELLAQMRDEAEGRLAEARAAIEHERARRLEAEQLLSQEGGGEPESSSSSSDALASMAEARAALEDAVAATTPDARYEALDRALALLGSESGASFSGPPAESDTGGAPSAQDAAWPTPWIDREDPPATGKGRRLFGRGSA